jgi:hypothetical protein
MVVVGIQAQSTCRPSSLALVPFQAGHCVRICEPPWYCAVVVAMLLLLLLL